MITLRKREHMAGGSKMVGKSICDKFLDGWLAIDVPRLFCPLCSFREHVRRRVRAGGRSFPGVTGPSFTDTPRCAADT